MKSKYESQNKGNTIRKWHTNIQKAIQDKMQLENETNTRQYKRLWN